MVWKYWNEEKTLIKQDDGMVITYPTGVEYLDKRVTDYLGEGNIIEDYVAPVLPTPKVYVTKLDIIDNLIDANKLVEAIDLINSDFVTKIRWEAATQIDITDSLAVNLCQALGLNPEDILKSRQSKSINNTAAREYILIFNNVSIGP